MDDKQVNIYEQIFGALDTVFDEGENADGLRVIGAILALPDEQFEAIKASLFDSIEATFNEPATKIAFSQMINQQGLHIEDFSDNMDNLVQAVEELTVEESTPVAVELEAAPVKEEAPKVVVSNDWTNYVVPSSKNLRRGSYYVQVASLGNTDNIKSFVDKYSAKYPVVLVRNSSTYQVMVGPLNIDEYGAVGENFKDYGFKDSFVRKIKQG